MGDDKATEDEKNLYTEVSRTKERCQPDREYAFQVLGVPRLKIMKEQNPKGSQAAKRVEEDEPLFSRSLEGWIGCRGQGGSLPDHR